MGALLSPAPVSERSDRLFFALFPDAEAAAQIAAQAQRIAAERGLNTPLAAERFYVTLHHLGDYDTLPQSILANAFVAGAALQMAPFTVTFDNAGSFKRGERSGPLVLRSSDEADVTTLQRSLGFEMKRTGLGNWVRGAFTPHVTLLYDDIDCEEIPIAPISWTVREVTLVHSLLGRTRHVKLAKWALRG
jgi:2'-5' RNA ligase